MNVNESLIEDSFKYGTIDSLCFFLYVKKQYRHSILYDYNATTASRKLRIPIQAVKHHVKYLKQLGIVVESNKHLHFIATNKALIYLGYKQKHLCTIKFDKTYKIKHIRALLLSKLTEMYTRQIDYCIKGKAALRLCLPKASQKKKLSNLKNVGIVRPENTITFSSLAKKLNLTKTTAWQIVQQAKELGLLTTRTIVKNLGYHDKYTMLALQDVGYGHYYYDHGCIYSVLGSEYQSSLYPTEHLPQKKVNMKHKDCSEFEWLDYVNWKRD